MHGDTMVVLAGVGLGEARRKVLDYYAISTRRYLGSVVLPVGPSAIALRGGRRVVVLLREPVPQIEMLTLRFGRPTDSR